MKVTASDARPTRPDECFYCRESIGGDHKPECVSIRKRVPVRFSYVMKVDVPNSWDDEQIEFWLNDGSSCMDYHVRRMARLFDRLDERDGCTCGKVRGEVDHPGAPPYADLVSMLTVARDVLAKLLSPAHLEGCLWLADHNMPCQCGSNERAATAVSESKRVLRVATAILEWGRKRGE